MPSLLAGVGQLSQLAKLWYQLYNCFWRNCHFCRLCVQDQYELLYDIVVDYLDCFATYSNFK